MQAVMDHQSSTKQPQISEMLSKFALAFKTKTIEFFAEEEDDDVTGGVDGGDDSGEEIITDLKVVVIKPDQDLTHPVSKSRTLIDVNPQILQTLISSIFATISSFEASYLQFQTAHVPFREENLISADFSAVAQLRKLSELKEFYGDLFVHGPGKSVDFSIDSCSDAHVQENQSKLRALETISNRLQTEIDVKDGEVLVLKQKLEKIEKANVRLSRNHNFSSEVLLSVNVFDSVLHEAFRSISSFTKLLIELMKKAGWDLDLAANYVHSDIDYAKKGDNRYAFLSYVCLVMFRGFDSKRFELGVSETIDSSKTNSLNELLDHVNCSPIEVLNRDPDCEFSKFCQNKYQELIHPTMELSIFSQFDHNEVVLNSWRSLSVFYKSFINMASSLWTLHKLAKSFDQTVEIFQVENGVEFSMIFMEDITKRSSLLGQTRAKVGFTVVPGFKIGRMVIQAQVYLNGLKCT